LAITVLATLVETAAAQALPPAGASPPPLDPLPHELHPDSWPQPDYFTEALKLTRFQGGERWRALKLAGGHEPEVLVMPVQMEAFGWTSAFAAILGARLDHELDVRHVDANRQTDLFDADGPYARRFTEAETAGFARAHAASRLLAMYVGRDGAGKDFLTLTLRHDGQVLRAHRTFAESLQVNSALDVFSAHFPAMLDELGLAATRTPSAIQPPRACDAGDWALADLTPRATRADRACRAISIGTLLPEFGWPSDYYPLIKARDKLAWLAEAWVEAGALSPDSATAVRKLAWSQLELAPPDDAVSSIVDAADPVTRALARGLTSYTRSVAMPVADRDASQQAYAQAAAAALPAFERAVLLERSTLGETFHRVRLCSLEVELPALRAPAECGAQAPTTRKQPPTRGERALLDAWRLAHAFIDLNVEGLQRGSPKGRQAVLEAMPPRIAAHPIIRTERFITEKFDDSTGSFDALAKRALDATTDAVQTTADLQRWSAQLPSTAISVAPWTTNAALRTDPAIVALARDDDRMFKVLALDGFSSRGYPPRMLSAQPHVNLLSPGLLEDLRTRRPPPPAWAASATGQPTSAIAVTPVPQWRAIQLDLFTPNMGFPGERSPEQTAKAVADDPRDLVVLTDLAMLRVKQGQDIGQARAMIDARLVDQRADAAISESHAWIAPASAFWFTGEFAAAQVYYRKVVDFDSYSSSDMQARVRLRLLVGDIPGALKASRERLARYGDDFSRRDTAAFEFMTGHPEAAWAVLAPRLPVSDQSELWMGVQVGQRMEGKSAREAADWIDKSGFGHALVGDIDIRDLYLVRFMTDDRTPSADDLALLAQRRAQRDPARVGGLADLQALALLKQLAAAPTVSPDDLRAVRALLAPQGSTWRTRGALAPLYAWNAWRASGGKDFVLGMFRGTELSQDLDALLARAVVLGLDGKADDALRTLRAARYDMAYTVGDRRRDGRSSPYTAAYVAWLLHGQTHDARYADEALLLARANQRIFPYFAWPYALEALLAPKGRARDAAACRAAFLDRGSLFLAQSGLKPDVRSATCRKSLW
jgi:hypothetical protein